MKPLLETIKIRVSPEDKALFEAEAERNGLSVSSWIRTTLKLLAASSFDPKTVKLARAPKRGPKK